VAAASGWRGLGLLAALVALPGCVSLHAPLVADAGYPPDWPPLAAAGPGCQGLSGRYLNAGVLAGPGGQRQPLALMALLHLKGPATVVRLDVRTRKTDAQGDTFATLVAAGDGDAAAASTLPDCFCVRQTLVCKVAQSGWSSPYVGFGASQEGLYLSLGQDGALVARLQNYHVDVVLAVPSFGLQEPWARFERAAAP
jgi:hypothetical protein